MPTLHSSETSPRLVPVFAAPDPVVAQLVQSMLHAEGIPSVLGEQITQAVAPSLRYAQGAWGQVCVAEGDAEIARALIDAYERGRGEVPAEVLAREAASAYDPAV